MKIVALDVGEKRIGVATADTAVRIAVAHSTVEVNGRELARIAKIMKDEGASHLVVGLPRNSRGEETAQSSNVRTFVAELQNYFVQNDLEKPAVKFQDESLTSVVAEDRMKKGKKTKKARKTDVDQEAATIILQDFLNTVSDNMAKEDLDKAKGKKKKKSKHRVLKFFAVLLALIAVAVVGAITWYAESIKPLTPASECSEGSTDKKCAEVEFVVTEGESTNEIADRLESENLIRSSLAFKIYLKLGHQDTVIRAGTFKFKSTMSVADVLNDLRQMQTAETFRITFLPGATIADAKKRLVEAGYGEDAVDDALAAEYNHPVLEGKPENRSLEGYIYGETYEFYTGATLEEILMRVFEELYTVVEDNKLVDEYAKHDLSLYEGITLASIVQREAKADDMPGVAQVFLTRLAQSMVLGSDAVIGYEADRINPGRDKTDMSYLTTIGCPWNSRQCAGLPPTPISSPGKAALLSVAFPADTNYIYFLTGDDGATYYAYDEARHQKNIEEHCQELCNYL